MRHIRLSLLAAAAVIGCAREPSSGFRVTDLASPVHDSVLNPWLAGGPDGRPILSWIAPLGGSRYALRFSTFGGGAWSAPTTVVEDDSIFIHATEIPSVRALNGSTLAAVWQRRSGGGGHHGSYGIRVAFSQDGGATWSQPVTPHRAKVDGATFEFPTAYRTAGGELGLFWIDPRRQTVRHKQDNPEEMDHVGSRNLMWTTVSPDGRLGPEVEVDSVACDCCPMDVALSGDATVFAYRDKELPPGLPIDSLRYETNVVRDIAVARLEAGGDDRPAWREAGIVHRDGWAYNGCPNNGPAVAAGDGRLAIAWWTGEGSRPRVQLAFSDDAGRSFGEVVEVTSGRPEGQVSVALVPDGAVVLWLEQREVYARLVRTDGSTGAPIVLGSSGGRHRLPAPLLAPDGGLVVTWLGPGSRLTSRRIVGPSVLAIR
jgi:hypothetical protein